MSIPLDRLYHYIESLAEKVHGSVIIYRFWPHGSKNLENLDPIHQNFSYYDLMTRLPIVCHDQEPLNFEWYQSQCRQTDLNALTKKYNCYRPSNLKPYTIFDQAILLHSEERSAEVEKYQNQGFIPVYYWCHAFIALDWFRFANHWHQRKHVQKTFLIYNRAWSGTREYRIKFTDHLISNDLAKLCKTTFNCVDPESNQHYSTHDYKNSNFVPENDLSTFVANFCSSDSSADFVKDDYETTDIEIVLETLFDDHRIHLTEKTLRPIACGQPFILVAPTGSLALLKQYGFKTFDSLWSEEYDQEPMAHLRLEKIVQIMKTIGSWSDAEKKQKLKQAKAIATYNKKYFFSKKFFGVINNELRQNLQISLARLIKENTSTIWLERRKELIQHQEIKNILTGKVLDPHFAKMPEDHAVKQNSDIKQEIMKVLFEARKFKSKTVDKKIK